MKSDQPAPVHAALPPEEFPFTIEAHDEDSGALLWFLVVTKAGPIHVPGFAPLKVRITIRGNDGSVSIMNSDGTEGGDLLDEAMGPHGRCDTCGAECDPDGCPRDRTHEVSIDSSASERASATLATAAPAQHQEVLDRIRADAARFDEQ